MRQAERKLDHQLASADAAQTRAGLVIAGLALSTSLIVGDISRWHDKSDVTLWLYAIGVAALIAAGLFLGVAIWPRKYHTAVTLPDNESAVEMARSTTASVEELVKINGGPLAATWLCLKAGIVLGGVHLLTWGLIYIAR